MAGSCHHQDGTLNNFHYNLESNQTSPRFLLLLIIKTCIICEGVQSVKNVGIHPDNSVHVIIEAISQF